MFAYVGAFYKSTRNIYPFHCNIMSFMKSRLRFLLYYVFALMKSPSTRVNPVGVLLTAWTPTLSAQDISS